MTEIPVITTARLRLRALCETDFPAYAAFYASDRAGFVGGPLGPKGTWKRFAAVAGHWALKGFGWWTVEVDGRPAGYAGLHHPPYQADMELGWTIYAPFSGRGLALEAARAALHWGWANLNPRRLVSYVDAQNAPSIRLAERLGATPEPGRAAHDPLSLTFVHPRPSGETT
ncbi:GNAT family N-acetyltransferase [Pseudoponticoccus marisrubri]|uniref:N-acetyltransferase domain-containing protein n=1 Tax=Pseudoponticoccus marisrubri TaxID=1685382 RepID=A0A0W7WFQ1_9RHOB|nr:GNAT family N-acetyltransferase [Pseudoponticoccus marisrubri]KUF09456.1 hypothetical protein AVJ23_17600 [Pseudoponticoccus marisrubri]